MSNFSSACDSNNLATCTADHFLPRAAGSRAPPSSAATARNDSQPPACSSWMVGASPPRLRTSPRPGMAPTSAWERWQGDSRTRREAATGLLNRHRQSRGRKSAHEKSSAGGRKLATLCLHSPGRAEYILWARVSQGAPGLVMLSSTCSYISAVTLPPTSDRIGGSRSRNSKPSILGQTYDALHVFFFASSATLCHARISSRSGWFSSTTALPMFFALSPLRGGSSAGAGSPRPWPSSPHFRGSIFESVL